MEHSASRLEKPEDSRLKPAGWVRRLNSNKQWPLDEQAAAYIIMFGESLGFWGHRLYTGHSITKKPDGWWLTVRASEKGKQQVAFQKGSTQQEAIKAFATALVYNLVKWQPDKFKA